MNLYKLNALFASVLEQERDNRLTNIYGSLQLWREKRTARTWELLTRILTHPHPQLFNPGHYTNLEQFLRELQREHPFLYQHIDAWSSELNRKLLLLTKLFYDSQEWNRYEHKIRKPFHVLFRLYAQKMKREFLTEEMKAAA